jgi:hypothetical protein
MCSIQYYSHSYSPLHNSGLFYFFFIAAYYVSPSVLETFHWNGLFIVYGAAGFLWLGLWLPTSADNPTSPSDCVPDSCSIDELLEQLEVQSEPIKTDTLQGAFQGMQDKLATVPWKQVVE